MLAPALLRVPMDAPALLRVPVDGVALLRVGALKREELLMLLPLRMLLPALVLALAFVRIS